MSFCPNCGVEIAPSCKFCSNCGNLIENRQDLDSTVCPQTAELARMVPITSAAPVVPVKAKVLGFVGMGLSIGGLVLASLGILFTLIGMGVTGFGFAMSLSYSLFSLPFAIAGLVLCKKSIGLGFEATACSVGSKLGIAGIAVSGGMLVCGMINLFV